MTRSQLRRALDAGAKSERREAIIRAAEGLLRESPFGDFAVDALARATGLAKGTLYLYFGSREEILLAVHHARLQRMFDALEAALSSKKAGPKAAARATLAFLRENPAFMPLAVNCRGMLETNVSSEAALAFKGALGERLAGIGARIEALYPGMPAGGGIALLMSSYALMLGLWQLSDPPSCLRDELDNPALQCTSIDFDRQLEAALLALWDGTMLRHGVEQK